MSMPSRNSSWKLMLPFLFLFCICGPGCLHVQKKADSVLTIRSTQPASSVVLGFREAICDKDGRVIAHGWHPKEHETYAYFIREPLPTTLYRWLFLEPRDQSRMEHTGVSVWLMQGLRYSATTERPPFVYERFSGAWTNSESSLVASRDSIVVTFNQVALTNATPSAERLTVCGSLRARVVSDEAFNVRLQQLLDSVELRTEQ